MRRFFIACAVFSFITAGCGSDSNSNDSELIVPETNDSGTIDSDADSGTPDSDADSGTIDSGTIDSGTIDSGTIDSGTIDSGTIDSGTIDSGTIDSGTIDSGTIDSDADSGTPLACGPTLVCADARLINSGSSISERTSGESNYNLSCVNTENAPEYVIHFTSEEAGTYTFSTAGSAFDTAISIRSDDCSGTEIACVDDVGNSQQAEATVTLEACESVVIIVDGYQNSSGEFQLTVTTSESLCDDSIDNDADGATDCDDSDCSTAPGCDSWPAEWAQLEIEILAETNRHRSLGANCGGTDYPAVGPLEMNEQAQWAARRHSKDMADNNYFEHDSQDGTNFGDRMSREGFSGASPWGENIAAGNGSAESILTQWMNSPGHCQNIMDSRYHVIGIGYAYNSSSSYYHYSTQDFAGSH